MKTTYRSGRLFPVVRSTSSETTRLGEHDVPRHFDVQLFHPDWPMRDCMLMVTVDAERGPIAAGLSNSRRGTSGNETDVLTYGELAALLAATLSGDELHRLLQRVTADAIRDLFVRVNAPDVLGAVDSEEWGDLSAAMQPLEDEARELGERALASTAPRRRRTVTPQLLHEVAVVYRAALARGVPPTQAVADHFYVSHSTSARWVGKARKAGELGPALGPQPGEETER